MERPTGWCHLSTISAHLQKTIKTASVSAIISWPSLINNWFICMVLVVAACYLGHRKKFLIDWLTDCYFCFQLLTLSCICWFWMLGVERKPPFFNNFFLVARNRLYQLPSNTAVFHLLLRFTRCNHLEMIFYSNLSVPEGQRFFMHKWIC